MKKCRGIKRMLSRYLDGEAGATDRSVVDSHLIDCPLCRKELSELSKVKGLASGADRKSLPQDYMVSRLRSALANARSAKERFSLADIGSFARRLIPVPVAAIIISMIFLVLVTGKPAATYSLEDHIFSERSATTETALEVILGSQN